MLASTPHPRSDRSAARREGLPSVYLPENCIGEATLYMNCGYWKHAPKTYDQACEDLVDLMATKAKIGPGDRVLDLGFGYADQTEFLLRRFQPAKIVGINVSPFQVETARRRFATDHRFAQAELQVGDAVNTGLPDASFDVVMAVECSAHFQTRDVFLKEAMRLLKPGGRLVIADVLVPDEQLSFVNRTVVTCCLAFWKAPRANLYTLPVYRQRIEGAGFRAVEAFSIREHVFQPLLRFVRAKVERRDLPKSMDPSLKAAYRLLTSIQQQLDYRIPLDYGVAVGTKPIG